MRTEYQNLCSAVEREAGKAMETPSDFEWLAEKIHERVKVSLSSSTLMRVWGYRQGVATRQATLDVLARYLGYPDYVMFGRWAQRETDGEAESDEVLVRHLMTKCLEVGQRVVLTWYPNRRCVVQLREDRRYEVVEAENTKLQVGQVFECDIFIDGEPMTLRLLSEGMEQMVYMAGKKNGIHFEVLNK